MLFNSDFAQNTLNFGVCLSQDAKPAICKTTGKKLHEIVRVGVWIKKEANSTTLSVYKLNDSDTTEFIFPLLNEKLHPIK